MPYKGQIAQLPMGVGGLNTDDPQNRVPSTALIRAINLQYYNGVLEKEAGSTRFNSSVLPSGVVGLLDWWPDPLTQRLIAVCRNGRIYRFRLGALPYTEVTPSDTSPNTIVCDEQMVFVPGGNEVTANPRKIFIFSQSIPQVISGDGVTRHKMSAPALDWTGMNQPSGGVVHRRRLVAFMGHNTYFSSSTDHEDFTSVNSATIPCYSGEAEKIIALVVYKGALFAVKFPFGIYQLIDTDPDFTNWYYGKIDGELGASSPHSIAAIINDVLIANASGSISSVTSTLNFGNLKTGEVLYLLRNENFMREETSQQGLSKRHAIYYSDKKRFIASYQSASGFTNDLLLNIDFNDAALPKVSWSTKDQANCLALRKDYLGVRRPIYGSEDGYIYLMDQKDRLVGSSAYSFEFQTPHLDLGFLNPTIADQNKNFQFLELDYEPTGDFSLSIDCYVDGRLMKTLEFNLSGTSNLDTLKLDVDNLDIETIVQKRLPLNLSGRRISFLGRQAGSNQNVQVAGLNLYFTLGGQQESSEGRQ